MHQLLMAQAATEYALITARQTFGAIQAFVGKAALTLANLVSTPRGVLLTALLVAGLLLSLGRKRRW